MFIYLSTTTQTLPSSFFCIIFIYKYNLYTNTLKWNSTNHSWFIPVSWIIEMFLTQTLYSFTDQSQISWALISWCSLESISLTIREISDLLGAQKRYPICPPPITPFIPLKLQTTRGNPVKAWTIVKSLVLFKILLQYIIQYNSFYPVLLTVHSILRNQGCMTYWPLCF